MPKAKGPLTLAELNSDINHVDRNEKTSSVIQGHVGNLKNHS